MDNSPLKKLAPELRNRIYEFVLLKRPLTSEVPSGTINIDLETSRLRTPPNALALLGTCKQIQQEANKIFYSNHIFVISEKWPYSNSLQCKADLLRRLLGRLRPETRMALKHLQMQSLWVHESTLLRRFQHISTHLNLESFVCTVKACDAPFDIFDFENSRNAVLEGARARIATIRAAGTDIITEGQEKHRIQALQEPKDVCLSCAVERRLESEKPIQKTRPLKIGLQKMSNKQTQRSVAPKIERWPEWPEDGPWWAVCPHF